MLASKGEQLAHMGNAREEVEAFVCVILQPL